MDDKERWEGWTLMDRAEWILKVESIRRRTSDGIITIDDLWEGMNFLYDTGQTPEEYLREAYRHDD